MNKKDINALVKKLKETYPDAKCSLDFNTPWELLVAVSLAAQCTDARVNQITPNLFSRCKTLNDYIEIDINELEKLIKPCGFYRNKAANIKAAASKVLNDFNGIVPKDAEELQTIPGIGRKSANVIMLDAFDIAQGIAVDTHAKRVSNRIGLSKQTDPNKIEKDLLKLFDKKDLKDINHLFVWHGRYCCTARNPQCDNCPIKEMCNFYK